MARFSIDSVVVVIDDERESNAGGVGSRALTLLSCFNRPDWIGESENSGLLQSDGVTALRLLAFGWSSVVNVCDVAEMTRRRKEEYQSINLSPRASTHENSVAHPKCIDNRLTLYSAS